MNRSSMLASLPVQSSDFVVEIGAGSQPYQFTKLILDKYPFENAERYGDVLNVAPIIQADAHKIPLADASCRLLFTSHVLEHLENPPQFLAEAKRCSQFIYLEFPTIPRELMYAWSFHKWLIEIDDKCLVFYKNDIPQLFGDFFHTNYDFLLDMWSQERFEELNAYLFVRTDEVQCRIAGETAFEHLIARSKKGLEKQNYPSVYGQTGMGGVEYTARTRFKMALWALTPPALIRARVQRQWATNRSQRKAITNEILARLLCQACRRGSLRTDGAELICGECQQRYTASDNVYNFDI